MVGWREQIGCDPPNITWGRRSGSERRQPAQGFAASPSKVRKQHGLSMLCAPYSPVHLEPLRAYRIPGPEVVQTHLSSIGIPTHLFCPTLLPLLSRQKGFLTTSCSRPVSRLLLLVEMLSSSSRLSRSRLHLRPSTALAPPRSPPCLPVSPSSTSRAPVVWSPR